MTLHFSQIGFTELLTFTVILLSIAFYRPTELLKHYTIYFYIMQAFFLLILNIFNTLRLGSGQLRLGWKPKLHFIPFGYRTAPPVRETRTPLRCVWVAANFVGLYLSRQMMRPLDKSYGDISRVTLSPGRIRM